MAAKIKRQSRQLEAGDRAVTSDRQRAKKLSASVASHASAFLDPLSHAVGIIYRVCCLAGDPDLLDEIRAELRADGVIAAIQKRDTAVIYDWLAAAFSYQGISDQVATAYMEKYGYPQWADIEAGLAAGASCPKLRSYWHFHGCRYDKGSRTCAEPDHIDHCSLPGHRLRNGRLNQMAYSLYLFMRDVADRDFVGWLDHQLQAADQPRGSGRPARLVAAVVEPMRHIYGLSDKVLTMALSCILLVAPRDREVWREAGGSMIAIDTLVHNFLHRTGVLRQFGTEHVYGPACYQPDGCADIIGRVAQRIDAHAFNPSFPATFPRFVQHAIWRYCAQRGLAVCNGNRIDDRKSCDNEYCQIRKYCDCIVLSNA
jgi:hypothetical protein